MITRRGFFGLLGGALVTEAARKIYVIPPAGGWQCKGGLITPGEALFYLDPRSLTYRFVYRNSITGHISDAMPEIARLVHTFAYPEIDVVDIYRQLEDGSFDYAETMKHATGIWGTKG